MKIVFTGGGTGGHFYPIIAVVQKVNKIIDEDKIMGAKLYYISNSPYDKKALFENGLLYEEVNAGKMRTYFSIKNFTDIFKMSQLPSQLMLMMGVVIFLSALLRIDDTFLAYIYKKEMYKPII